jgi:hypothetical protein
MSFHALVCVKAGYSAVKSAKSFDFSQIFQWKSIPFSRIIRGEVKLNNLFTVNSAMTEEAYNGMITWKKSFFFLSHQRTLRSGDPTLSSSKGLAGTGG